MLSRIIFGVVMVIAAIASWLYAITDDDAIGYRIGAGLIGVCYLFVAYLVMVL